MLEKRGAQCARDVRPALAPVKASVGESTPELPDLGDIDSDRGQLLCSLAADIVGVWTTLGI